MGALMDFFNKHIDPMSSQYINDEPIIELDHVEFMEVDEPEIDIMSPMFDFLDTNFFSDMEEYDVKGER
jgi:hypothetical protein